MLLVAHRMPRTASECEAFVAAGAGMFECDVQLRGSTVVVSHFLPFLGRRGWLKHDNSRFRWRDGVRHRDPPLLDALALLPASCGVLLDPKETDRARRARLADELARLLPDRSRLRVSTDREGDLERFRAAGFQTWRTIKNAGQLRAALTRAALPDNGVSVRHSLLDAAAVTALRGVAATIAAWTVNSPARALALRGLGVDAVTTDDRAVMRALIG